MFKVIDGKMVECNPKVTVEESKLLELAKVMADRHPAPVRAFWFADSIEVIEQTLNIKLRPA